MDPFEMGLRLAQTRMPRDMEAEMDANLDLTALEIKALIAARRWLRLVATARPAIFDDLEREGMREAGDTIEGILLRARTPEPQLFRPVSGQTAGQQHARAVEGVCGSCGGRSINGVCAVHCERDQWRY